MKITLLSAAYPYRGGIAQFNTRLHKELQRKSHEVTSVTFKRQYPSVLFPGKTQFVTDSDNAEALHTKRWLDTVNPISYHRTAKQINKREPDVLITRYWMPFFGPSMGYVAKKMRSSTKRFAILDNVIPHEQRFFDKKFTRYFLNQHDGFIVMSEQVKKDLLQFKPDAEVLVVNHPIYDQFGSKVNRGEACLKLGINPEKHILLFFGFIRDYKGLDILIDTIAKLDESYELVIAGECYGSFEKYQNQINLLGIGDRVHIFNKYISDQEVSLYFSAADVLMLTYRSATQSGISAIALHFECPSIATSVGGLKEVVKNGENGLLVDSLKPLDIAETVQNYFKNKQMEAFSTVLRLEKQKYSWEYFTVQLIDFLKNTNRIK